MGYGRKIVLVICLIVFVGSAGMLLNYFIDGMREQNALEELSRMKTDREDLKTDKGTVIGKYVDLYLANKDIIGWITVDDTKIDYPVMQTQSNPEYYLHVNFNNEYSDSGTPFMDANSDIFIPTSNFLIYGHHMDNSRMFGDLDLYKDQTFFEENSSGTLILPDRSYDLEIFACLLVPSSEDAVFDTQQWQVGIHGLLDFISSSAMYVRQDVVDEMRAAKDAVQILAMSTCASEYTDARTIIMAKMKLHSPEGKQEGNS